MFNRILVAVDDREATERTVKAAGELAQRFNARLSLIHVLEPAAATGLDALACMPAAVRPNMHPGMTLMQKLRPHLPSEIPVDEYIVFGSAGKEIVRTAEAWKADLIILGVHNRDSRSARHLCTTADEIVQWAPCAILFIPAKQRSMDDRTTQSETIDASISDERISVVVE